MRNTKLHYANGVVHKLRKKCTFTFLAFLLKFAVAAYLLRAYFINQKNNNPFTLLFFYHYVLVCCLFAGPIPVYQLRALAFWSLTGREARARAAVCVCVCVCCVMLLILIVVEFTQFADSFIVVRALSLVFCIYAHAGELSRAVVFFYQYS